MPSTQFLMAISALITFLGAFFALLKSIYHSWFVVTGIRPSMQTKASLLGPFALFVPSLFEEKAQTHLRRLAFWLPVAIGLVVATLLLKQTMGEA